MSVPNTFAGATSAIPLANLDANFQYYDTTFQISSNNLGVGTNSPTAKVHISVPSSYNQLILERTTTSTGKYLIYTQSNSLYFNDTVTSSDRMIINATGDILVGTSNANGSTTNTNTIASGGVFTAKGITTITSGSATTIFGITAANTGRYEIVTVIKSSGNSAAYTSFATLIWDGTSGRIVANNGTGLTITLSSSNVQVTQTSGVNQDISWSYQRIAV
jgi:hypothetical protein